MKFRTLSTLSSKVTYNKSFQPQWKQESGIKQTVFHQGFLGGFPVGELLQTKWLLAQKLLGETQHQCVFCMW